MSWFHAHHVLLGILADSLTFLGGFILARDAFRRLKEMKSKRISEEFRSQFPRLNLSDEEWKEAVTALRWTFAGFVLLLAGFSFQLLLRFIEP
jgi:hypothetical protein